MNYKCIVQYDGTRYGGWQRQQKTENTIQGKIEQVLTKMMGYEVEIKGAGRTDAGVHALGQCCNFQLMKCEKSCEEILKYINDYLPQDIGVISLTMVPERFHSRLNAVKKTYRYRIGVGNVKNVFDRKCIYCMGESLDVDAMEEAASYLIGKQDFKGFCGKSGKKKSTVRNLEKIEIRQLPTEIQIDYTGDGFLYNMVRILTGTLIEVGQKKRTPKEVKELLEVGDRTQAGETAPACGLTLMSVEYSPETGK